MCDENKPETLSPGVQVEFLLTPKGEVDGLGGADSFLLGYCCPQRHGKLTCLTHGDQEKAAMRASQVVLVVKNLPATAGDVRDVHFNPGSRRYP